MIHFDYNAQARSKTSALSKMTLIIKEFSKITDNIMTIRTTTQHNNTQHNNIQHNDT
jgi:hypothetical protein